MNDNHNGYGSGQGRPVYGYEPIIDNDDLSRYELTPEERAYEELIRQRIRQRRRAAERRRIKRNRTVALILLFVIVLIICRGCYASHRKKREEQAGAKMKTSSSAADKKQDSSLSDDSGEGELNEPVHKIQNVDGLTYVDGILIVNKTYSLPSDYAPGVNTAAQAAFEDMMGDAYNDGIVLYINSGYRSYEDQETLYYNYAAERGVAEADKVSSRPGYSEHQSGLCFDINSTDFSFADTAEARWLAAHCSEYGFIIRFPKDKEDITGYEYEPWHIRFVGLDNAKKITESGLCLEEYLGVTSDYKDAADGISQERMAEQLGVNVNGSVWDNGYDDGQDWDNNDYGY